MTEAWVGVIGTLSGIIVGAVLQYFFSKKQSKNQTLLGFKIKVYSNVLIKLNTVFQDGDATLLTDPLFKEKVHFTMARTLTQARLLANPKLEKKLRDYYDCAIRYWTDKDKKCGDEMSNLVIEIEQLMRKEIGEKKLY
jgi:hypothetical protein